MVSEEGKQRGPAGSGATNASQKRMPTLGEVLFAPLTVIPRMNVGFLNLLCATFLPDTFGLNIQACLKKLMQWTKAVKEDTEKRLPSFRRDPAKYRNSEAYFRVLNMITVLQLDCGLHYNKETVIDPMATTTANENFIHGPLNGIGGTCANIPVIYAAIGRVLGYPIKLVQAKSHLFCRWDNPVTGERFNIEGSGKGLNVYSDEYYMKWPKPITEREVSLGHFLVDLDPLEELSVFLVCRGRCLVERNHLLDAMVTFVHAHRLAPTKPLQFALLLDAINCEVLNRKMGRLPGGFSEAEMFTRECAPAFLKDLFKGDLPPELQAKVKNLSPDR